MKTKNIIAHITRSWSEENTTNIHPRLKFLPPFTYELMAYLLLVALIYKAISILINLLN